MAPVTIDTLTEQLRALDARISDLLVKNENTGRDMFTSFLTPAEQTEAKRVVSGKASLLWGGYDTAERKMLMIGDGETKDFPIGAVTFTYRQFREEKVLTHRDFLGALINLGIKRETLGDILVGEGYCIVFAEKHLVDFILQNADKIGRIGVKAEEGLLKPIPQRKFQIIQGVTSSLRLDCLVSFLSGQSREKSSGLIRSGMVQVDNFPCVDVSRTLETGSTVSIRGSGRYILDAVGGTTKKGKLHVEIKKYM